MSFSGQIQQRQENNEKEFKKQDSSKNIASAWPMNNECKGNNNG
jgi:hypothetical protein